MAEGELNVDLGLLDLEGEVLDIQVHLNKLECREKVHFFLQVISKSETFIYFRFIACKVKHFKSFFVLILMIRAYSS